MAVAGSVFLYTVFCACLFLAYFATRFAALRRETCEKLEKGRKQQ
jgi:hypothetical protein